MITGTTRRLLIGLLEGVLLLNASLLGVDAELVPLDVGNERSPVQAGWVDSRFLDGMALGQLNQLLALRIDEVGSVDEFQYPQSVEGKDNVLGHDGRAFADIHNAELGLIALVEQKVNDGARPVWKIGLLTHIGNGLLGTSNLLLFLAELVGEGDEESTIAFALMSGECQNTGQIVPNIRVFLLTVVTDGMVATLVHLAEHVKQEGIDVKEEGFVIQKHFGNVAQILAVNAFLEAIDLKHAEITLAVDLVAGGMTTLPGQFLGLEAQEFLLPREEAEGKFAHVEDINDSTARGQ